MADYVTLVSTMSSAQLHRWDEITLEKITEIYCDTASLTSVNLLKVLLAERGLPVPGWLDAPQEALPDWHA